MSLAAQSSDTASHASSFDWPNDWPAKGLAIDLNVQDLPHKSSTTEWWYINAHLKTVDQKSKGSDEKSAKQETKLSDFSMFASFFRLNEQPATTDVDKSYHALAWALVVPEISSYIYDSLLDNRSVETLKKNITNGNIEVDERIKQALLENLAKNSLPLPDRLMNKSSIAVNGSDRIHDGKNRQEKNLFSLNYDGQRFEKLNDGSYFVECINESKTGFKLNFLPIKSAIRQGNDGAVKVGIQEQIMFYYSIPRCRVKGIVLHKGVEFEVEGEGWYDHEFGHTLDADREHHKNDNVLTSSKDSESKDEKKANKSPGKKANYAWNWLALLLDDNTDVTATILINIEKKETIDNYCVVSNSNDDRHVYYFPASKWVPTKTWTSIRTTLEFPVEWKLDVDEIDLHLTMKASFEAQEFITLLSHPSFWEGRMEVEGTHGFTTDSHGKKIPKRVRGKGFLERKGFQNLSSLDIFFKRISKLVNSAIEKILPMNPTNYEVQMLMATKEFPHYMEGVNIETYKKTIIHPLREIVDRGGKSWRSFAMLLCIDSVGGNSLKFQHFLALPEIMHVGSLIIDDIQDKSAVRRGGPACHILHGDAIAINAGTAAYFLPLYALLELIPDISNYVRLRMYDIFFLTLRAGHAGQAFDIYGQAHMMDEVVRTGNADELEKAVICTHRLKSANPAGNLARVGALIGGGTEEQIESLGMFFEQVGIAFQIIDDVLNLRGFKGNTKQRGEDISAGKITYPIAKGMSLLKNADDRKYVWDIVQEKTEDRTKVESVITRLEQVGTLEACEKEAKHLVESVWKKLDKCIADSYYKLLLKAFGFYVLDRHY